MTEHPHAGINEHQRALDEAIESREIANQARALLGMPPKTLVSMGVDLVEALPRYRNLSICIRAALYSLANGTVRHMVERNRALDELRAMEQVMGATA